MGTVVPPDLHRTILNVSTLAKTHPQDSLDWRTFGMVSEVKSQVRSSKGSGAH